MNGCWRMWLVCLLVAGVALPLTAFAHNNGKSFLAMQRLDSGEFAWRVQWDLSFRDLDLVLDLDSNLDGKLTHGEIADARNSFIRLPGRVLNFSAAGQDCRLGQISQKLAQKPAGKIMRLQFDLRCPGGSAALELKYLLLFGVDATHRALLEVDGQSQIITPGELTRLAGTDPGSNATGRAFFGFVASGVGHILSGWDHLAFLVALLIPVLLFSPGRGQASRSLRSKRLLWVISAFTLAHSFTLCLAVLDLVTVPVQPIEAAIAASIIFAAIASFLNRATTVTVPMACVFGLLHGFGFANVMQETGASSQSLAFALFGFNLGVEIGQFIFVALLLPAFWALARIPKVAHLVAPAMSALLVILGTNWLIDRLLWHS